MTASMGKATDDKVFRYGSRFMAAYLLILPSIAAWAEVHEVWNNIQFYGMWTAYIGAAFTVVFFASVAAFNVLVWRQDWC